MAAANPDVVLEETPRGFAVVQAPPSLRPLLDGLLSEAVAHVADEVFVRGGRVEDYLVALPGDDALGRTVSLSADALPPPHGGGPRRVILRVRDVRAAPPERREVSRTARFHGLIGPSAAMREVFRKIAIYGPADAPVVVTGETGTGKELTAQALHQVSRRREGPFVAVNCSAIAAELFESELFGHDRGSFTGATRTHRGRFERASGGTLFLDEVGDMPLQAQAKLLRVLEADEVERVGGEKPVKVDVRVVAATNVALEESVGRGRFRADLFHRISVFRIHLPPLREHPEDLPVLADHFVRQYGAKYGRQKVGFTEEALTLLADYSWPGNVRELRNVIERVVVEQPDGPIGREAFREWARERIHLAQETFGRQARPTFPALPPAAGDGGPVIEAEARPRPVAGRRGLPADLDPEAVRRAFRETGGNLTRTAALLGVHKATLYRSLKRLGLSRDGLGAPDKEEP